jgi:hypothetical protein
MTDSPDPNVGGCKPCPSRQSAIPIRSIYLRSSELLDASITTNRPSTSSSVNKRWKIDKLPPEYSNAPLNPSTPENDWRLESEPPWTRIPTEEPLSPELRAGVEEDLIKAWYFSRMEDYRRNLKASWFEESFHLSIKNLIPQLEPRLLGQLCNKLTSFYWMPSAEFDGRPLPLLPFGCIFKEWLRYHNDEPNIELGNFFAHLVRVYPTGPTTIQGMVEAHKALCNEAASLLERISRGEAKDDVGGPWREPQNYNLKTAYRAIIIMMDQYVDPGLETERDFTTLINLEEHSKNQTLLLVRTGDDSHLSTPISFETLRANDLCLPLARTDVPATSDVVVRVSLSNAVKFVADLQQREDTTLPQPSPLLETERKAKEWADMLLEEADEKGIDNVSETWSAVRRVKAARMGETFEVWEPYPFNRYWK